MIFLRLIFPFTLTITLGSFDVMAEALSFFKAFVMIFLSL